MTLQQIEIVTKVAEYGSINMVARSMGLTQPAISTAISVLEKEFGASLFIRSRQGAILTPKGREVLSHFRTIIKEVETVTRQTKAVVSDEGTISVAGRQGFMQYLFPVLYKELSTAFPKIIINTIISGTQEEVVEALLTGKVDICFAPSPGLKSIASEILYSDPVILAISKQQYRILQASTKHSYSNLKWCLPTKNDRLRKSIEHLVRTIDEDPKIITETDDYTLIGRLIASGQCAGPIYGHMLGEQTEFRNVMPMIPRRKWTVRRDLTMIYRYMSVPLHVRSAMEIFKKTVKETLDTTLAQFD